MDINIDNAVDYRHETSPSINPSFGAPLEIATRFGDKTQYQQALIQSTTEIYREVA